VALDFATPNTAKIIRNSDVWMVNYKIAPEHVPATILGMANDREVGILTSEILERLFDILNDLDTHELQRGDFVFFYAPPTIDHRIYNQCAHLSITSRPNLSLEDSHATFRDA
jgi:hypothetical protein